MKGTVAQVNAALRKAGKAERLARGRGYYYFRDGNATAWPESAVYVNRADALTVAEWLREHERLSQG